MPLAHELIPAGVIDRERNNADRTWGVWWVQCRSYDDPREGNGYAPVLHDTVYRNPVYEEARDALTQQATVLSCVQCKAPLTVTSATYYPDMLRYNAPHVCAGGSDAARP